MVIIWMHVFVWLGHFICVWYLKLLLYTRMQFWVHTGLFGGKLKELKLYFRTFGGGGQKDKMSDLHQFYDVIHFLMLWLMKHCVSLLQIFPREEMGNTEVGFRKFIRASGMFPETKHRNASHIWSRVLLENLIVTQLVKKSPSFYGTWRVITVVTRDRHWSSAETLCKIS